jgi:hypothetical protein
VQPIVAVRYAIHQCCQLRRHETRQPRLPRPVDRQCGALFNCSAPRAAQIRFPLGIRSRCGIGITAFHRFGGRHPCGCPYKIHGDALKVCNNMLLKRSDPKLQKQSKAASNGYPLQLLYSAFSFHPSSWRGWLSPPYAVEHPPSSEPEPRCAGANS